ncbi:hypothetical protein [Serratia symbiotica]|uniref:hypothetical protein n=1 Tax=Serratia symbiotica TaxID=138074 RepID=UPI0013608FA1|nr:hypothetical protein [Serratia symbiotica]MBQ0955611.1 hypothetical protein [Serratia symbiotica]
MQQCIVVAALFFWFALSGLVSHVYTAQATRGGLFIVWPLMFSLPFQLRVLGRAERLFRPSLTLISRRRRRAWVHLAPWQPTTNLTPEQIHAFWCSVNASTYRALADNHTVIVSSHLLTGSRVRRLLAHLTENACPVRHRVFNVPFSPAARAVMQLEILFRQWRWRSPARTQWPVMVIRNHSSDAGK